MNSLIPSFDPQGLPAPVGLLLALKVFGFWLHLVFMGLWFAGFPVGLLLQLRQDTAPLGARLLKTMPVWIAFGVNAGVVPLLFLQVLYPGLFYTSSILQAWWWFAVIPLVMMAYYGTYLYALHGLKEDPRPWTRWVGWGSALLFLFLGVMFASTLTLTVHPEAWVDFAGNMKGGAFQGTWLYGSFEVVERYLMVFALGLLSVAAFFVVDTRWLAPSGDRAVRARPVVLGLVLAGSLVFLLASLPYLVRIRPYLPPVWHGAIGGLMVLTFAFGTVYAFLGSSNVAVGFVLFQLLNLLANAVARQVVQHHELIRYVDLTSVPVRFQFSPLLLFGGTLLVGLLAVFWMLKVYIRASRGL